MKKSVLCLLLAVLMVFGMFPLGAFAAETDAAYTADEDATVQEAETGEDAEPPQGEAEEPADAELADTGADDDLADTGAIKVTGPVGVTGVTEPKNGYYPSYTGISALNSSEYKINSTYSYGSYKNGIMWKDENGDYINPSSAPAFQTGKKYTVVVFLVPASSSYEFDENSIKAKTNTVNGNAATKVGFWNNTEMYLEYTFTAYRRLTYVSANISVPVPGNTPSYSCTVGDSSAYYATGSDSYYKNGIKWVEDGVDMTVTSGKKFVAGKKYTVYIALKPQTNYKFAPKVSLSGDINGNTATVGQWTEGSYIYLTKEYTCTAQKISTVNITGVTAPKIGATPSYAATASGTGYKKEDLNNSSGWTSGVCWKDSSGNTLSSSSKFEAGKSYMVRVSVIRTSDAYEFSSSVNVKINGNTAVTSAWGGISKTENFIAEYTFPTLTNTKVSTASLYGFTAPTIGAKPVYQINSGMLGCHVDTSALSYSTNGVYWKDETANTIMSSTDTFKANHVYSIGTALTADTGYEFAVSGSSPAVSVKFDGKAATGTGSVSGKQPFKTLCAWYKFPALQATVIGAAAATVTTPEIGAKVSKTATVTSGYSGYTIANMYWYNLTDGTYPSESDTFKENKEYRCFVDITANTGYEFRTSSGSPSINGYINGKSATVTKAGTSYSASERVTLNYTFPKMSKTAVSTVATTVTGPAYGKAPSYVASATSSPYYEIYKMNYQNFKDGVCWIDDTANKTISPSDTSYRFIAGHRYTAQVMIKIKDSNVNNYKFADSVSGTMNGASAVVSGYGTLDKDVYRIMANSFLCSGGTEISSVAVTVTAPVIGKTPDFEGGVSTTGVRVSSIIWYDLTDSKYIYQNDAFLENHKYDACIVLRTNDDGYYFKNENGTKTKVTGTLNGSTAQTASYASNSVVNCICVNYEFSELTYTSISKIGISGVTPPVAGLAPLYVVPNTSESTKYVVYKDLSDNVKYSGGQCWWDKTAGKAVNPSDNSYRFIAGHEYQYQAMVCTLPGYKFAAKVSSTINGSAAVTYTKNGYSSDFYRCVYIDFPAATATISSAAAEVTAPVAGQSRAYSATANGNGYKVDTSVNFSGVRNGVSWYKDGTLLDANNSEKFIKGVKYQVRIFLATENEYYTFSSHPTGKVNGNTASVYNVTSSKKVYLEYEFTCSAAAGSKVTAVVKSFLASEDVTVELKQGETVKYTETVKSAKGNSTTTVAFTNVAPGKYTLSVSKKDHVDREYAVTVNGTNVTQDVKICPIGDANNDGKVNAKDSNAIMRHISKASILTGYNLACANANGDTKVNAKDVNRILRHISKAEPLF